MISLITPFFQSHLVALQTDDEKNASPKSVFTKGL